MVKVLKEPKAGCYAFFTNTPATSSPNPYNGIQVRRIEKVIKRKDITSPIVLVEGKSVWWNHISQDHRKMSAHWALCFFEVV